MRTRRVWSIIDLFNVGSELEEAVVPLQDVDPLFPVVLLGCLIALATRQLPVALAALNTEPSEASWPLLAAVFGRLFTERACRPWIASDGVGELDEAAMFSGDDEVLTHFKSSL